MAYLEWKPEYSVGSQAIDDEHREMIDLINTLRVELGDAADKESIERFLGDIQSGIAMHFALEERLMRDNMRHTSRITRNCSIRSLTS